jgi:MucR family transcriptional regulator, transcriptional regulator of exopolysaccharide biosynthesis
VKQAKKTKEIASRRKSDDHWQKKAEIQSSSLKTLENSPKGRVRSTQMVDEKFENNELVEFTTQIVSAYVANNSVVAGDLPGLINDVHGALSRASANLIQAPKEELKPAVPIKKSLTPDYIICLEDGKKFKSLKRHLRTHYDMSPEQYREKWGLEPGYPMVAPKYAEARSSLAKKMGLGQRKGR